MKYILTRLTCFSWVWMRRPFISSRYGKLLYQVVILYQYCASRFGFSRLLFASGVYPVNHLLCAAAKPLGFSGLGTMARSQALSRRHLPGGCAAICVNNHRARIRLAIELIDEDVNDDCDSDS